MKKILLTILILTLLVPSVALARPLGTIPASETAFVDGAGGSAPRLTSVTVPLTSSPSSVISNRSSLITFSNDAAVISSGAVGGRIVVHGNIWFSTGSQTWMTISFIVKDGLGNQLSGLGCCAGPWGTVTFGPVATVPSTSFYMQSQRDLTEADFANGPVSVYVRVAHNASLTMSYGTNLQFEVK